MNKSNNKQHSNQYYNVGEDFTSRIDIDPTLKWILTNMINKLRIPKEMLPDGEYTFCASNVAKEMGLDRKTTYNKFKALEALNLITNAGELITTHGKVIKYRVHSENFEKLISGELKMVKMSYDKKGNLKMVGCLPITQGCVIGRQPCLAITQPCLAITHSNQIEQPNESTKESSSNKVLGKNILLGTEADKVLADYNRDLLKLRLLRDKGLPEPSYVSQEAALKEYYQIF
jgi:hypothetical protein